MKVLVSIRVIPIGTNTPSMSDYVAEVIEVLKNKRVKYALSPFGTALELDNIAQVTELIEEIKNKLRDRGVSRLAIDVSFDLRFDKEITLEYKVQSVEQKLQQKRRS